VRGSPSLSLVLSGGRRRYSSYIRSLAPTAYWRFNDLASPPTTNAYDSAVLARADTVAYWELGEASGTTAANSVSGGLYPGTISGNPTLGVAGPLIGSSDTAIDFDGTGDYSRASYAAALNPANFTATAWVWRDVDTGGAEYILHAATASHGFGIRVSTADKLQVLLGDGAATSAASNVSTSSIATGRWTHIAVSHDGTSVRIYVDGVLEATVADGYAANPSAGTTIGANSGGTEAFSGKIAKVSLHNAVLTSAEIASLFVKGRPVSDTQGNHAGGMIDAPVSATGAITGDSDACFDFDGSNDHIVVPYSAALNAATFSVAGWLKRDTDTGSTETVLSSRSGTGTSGWTVHVNANDKVVLVLGDGVAASENVGTTSLVAGTWYHFVVTYDGTNARVYVNGALESTTADAYAAQTSQPTRIAANHAVGAFFNGKIDELTYHGSRVLTATEIATAARIGARL
jgi:hypothetical protein